MAEGWFVPSIRQKHHSKRKSSLRKLIDGLMAEEVQQDPRIKLYLVLPIAPYEKLAKHPRAESACGRTEHGPLTARSPENKSRVEKRNPALTCKDNVYLIKLAIKA